MKRDVIGEGGYGCVHKPSIKCINNPAPNFNYSDYVSKLMNKKHAADELDEFLTMNKFDPTNEYYLGVPYLCKPKISSNKILDDIKKCTYIESNDVKLNEDKYRLLIMKYGGPDLKTLCVSELIKYLATNKKNKTDKFWLEVHHLLKGLKFFRDNGLVHNDLKPQNILFNTKTGKLSFIDFGLMKTKKKIMEESSRSNNFLGIFHWNFPLQCGFMNKKIYKRYKTSSSIIREKYNDELSEIIINNSNVNTLKLPIKPPTGFNVLFAYINPDGTIPIPSIRYRYIQDFFNGLNNLVDNYVYEEVLEKIVDSIDIYSLGFTLQYILNCFNHKNMLPSDFFNKASLFFYKMYNFNPSAIQLDIDILLDEYEHILLETGILKRLKKTFQDHKVVNKVSKSRKNKNTEKLSPVLESHANLNPLELKDLNKCKEHQELNILTNRCVKKCKDGYIRNDKFKCVKNKTRKTKSK
jgi:serine/threonine protein kinase